MNRHRTRVELPETLNSPRAYPRTLQQAFGPYTDHKLLPMASESSWRAADMVTAVILAVVVFGLLWGLL